jgi:hypothetical protein
LGNNSYSNWRLKVNVSIHQLRVNVKSLAAEATIIREEVRKARVKEAKDRLYHHRVWRLKPEARLAHLALAYIKGVPYKKVEPNTKNPPSADALTQKLRRFVHVNLLDVRTWLANGES